MFFLAKHLLHNTNIKSTSYNLSIICKQINNVVSQWEIGLYRLIPDITYVTLLEFCIDQSETRNGTTVHISATSYITFKIVRLEGEYDLIIFRVNCPFKFYKMVLKQYSNELLFIIQ